MAGQRAGQERDAASALDGGAASSEPLVEPLALPHGLRAASAHSFWVYGPETEQAPSLRFLATGPRAELSVADAREAGGRRQRRRGAPDGRRRIRDLNRRRPHGRARGQPLPAGVRLPDAPVEIGVAAAADG